MSGRRPEIRSSLLVQEVALLEQSLSLTQRVLAETEHVSPELHAEWAQARRQLQSRFAPSRRLGTWLAASLVILAAGGGWFARGYEFGATPNPLQHLQGTWRQYEVTPTGEVAKHYYKTIRNRTTTAETYPPGSTTPFAQANYSFELVPERDIYLLKSTVERPNGPGSQTECLIQLEPDRFGEIRGVVPLDTLRKPGYFRWRRVDKIPEAQ